MSRVWSEGENARLIDLYLAFLVEELNGIFRPTSELKTRGAEVTGRSVSSVSYKASNVSAVLAELGFPYLSNFKPLFNIQRSLREATEKGIADAGFLEVVREYATAGVEDRHPSLEQVDPPNLAVDVTERVERQAVKVDFLKLEQENKLLGLAGELAVLRHLVDSLTRAGRTDLAQRVEHVSQTLGDGLGYDIAAFDIDGSPLYAEVKATRRPADHPFLLTENERLASKELGERYRLYRVFGLYSRPGFYVLRGNLAEACALKPKVYWASPVERSTSGGGQGRL